MNILKKHNWTVCVSIQTLWVDVCSE